MKRKFIVTVLVLMITVLAGSVLGCSTNSKTEGQNTSSANQQPTAAKKC